MLPSPRASSLRLATVCLSSLILAAGLACGPDEPTAVGGYPDRAGLAKAPAGPTVTAAAPDSASQGVTLDVHVFGSGFTAGAVATWQRNGVANPAKVRTNATTVVNAGELVANITIADSADVASWDVQVALVGGKKGIGTELFKVTAKVPPPQQGTGTGPSGGRWVFGTLGTTIDPSGNVTLQPAGVFGDGRDVSGATMGSTPTIDPYVGTSSGDYQDVLCGLAFRVYWFNSFAGSGDATLDPSLQTPSSCPPRVLTVASAATPTPLFGFMNAFKVMQIPLNASRRQIMRIRVEQPNCFRLTWGTSVSDTDMTATSGGVRVTRVAGTPPTTHVLSELPGYVPGEWVVETIDGHATCENQKGQRWIAGESYTGLYFRIHITEIPPTP
jgi:hypothetical protein